MNVKSEKGEKEKKEGKIKKEFSLYFAHTPFAPPPLIIIIIIIHKNSLSLFLLFSQSSPFFKKKGALYSVFLLQKTEQQHSFKDKESVITFSSLYFSFFK